MVDRHRSCLMDPCCFANKPTDCGTLVVDLFGGDSCMCFRTKNVLSISIPSSLMLVGCSWFCGVLNSKREEFLPAVC